MTDFGSGGARRRKGGVKMLPLLGVFGALLLALGACGWVIQQVEERKRQEDIASAEIERALDLLRRSDGKAVIDVTPRASGSAGVMERLFKEVINTIAGDNRQMDEDLKALGFPDLMEPEALGRSGGLDAADSALAGARKVVAKYAALRKQRLEDFKDRVRTAKLPRFERQELLLGLERGLKESALDNDRVWTIQDQVVQEFQGAVAALRASKGRWVVRANSIEFYRDADMRAYNDRIYKVQRLEWEFRNLQNKRAPRRGGGDFLPPDVTYKPVEPVRLDELPPEVRREVEKLEKR